jgi:hypothetical protein
MRIAVVPRPLLVCVCLLAASVNAQTIVFIGSPRAVELSMHGCDEYLPAAQPNGDIVCLDRAFLLRYQVERRLLGAFAADTIEFVGFHHYRGMPNYTLYEPALIVLERLGGHWLLRRIEFIEERRGRWWVCDEWPERQEDECTIGRFVEQVVEEYR